MIRALSLNDMEWNTIEGDSAILGIKKIFPLFFPSLVSVSVLMNVILGNFNLTRRQKAQRTC